MERIMDQMKRGKELAAIRRQLREAPPKLTLIHSCSP